MEYRGSKSVFTKTVKEQRVDGSWLLKNKLANPIRSLRFTLMGLETGYQLKIPAKQLINRAYSTLLNKLNPWFLTGFTDAESALIISIYKDEKTKLKLKWRVSPSFSIHIHIKDLELLELIPAKPA